MALSSPGIGSNLDINGIVSQLMALERQPLNNISQKEAGIKAKLSAIGNLKSALSTFQTAVRSLSSESKFQAVRATAADTAVATVSGSGSATPGTYSLEVSKLAQAQKLASAGQASDKTAIGTGTITFDFGTIELGASGSFDPATGKYTGATFKSNGAGVKTVKIDSSNNSLAGIRDAINKADIGVTASIVNDGGTSPYRLVLTEQSTGKTNSMKISVAEGGGLGNLLNHDPGGTQALTETMTAQNAEFKVDGLAISKPTNVVSDAIPGVTLTLAKTNAGSPTSITVTRDTAAVTTAVTQFVTAYNQINQTLTNLSSYNTTTKVAGVLNGDATVRTIQTQIRGLLSAQVEGGGAFSTLSQVGVSLQKDGTLAVDNDKLKKAMESNFNDIAALFAATGKATDSLVSYVSATNATAPGTYAVNVTKLATQGKTVGQAAAALTIGASNDTLEVKLDGKTATIKLEQKTYASADALAAEVQAKINGAADLAGSSVTVSQTGGVLTIMSARYGSDSNVSITGGNGKAGLVGGTPTTTDGVNVEGTINGVAAKGSGQFLTGADKNAAEGLKVQITGTALGNRGTVSYSKGYAYQFDKMIDSMLATKGPVSSRTDGFNESLKSLDKQKERINDRLEQVEKRYRAQFAALDVMLANMTKTSNYLAQQLANLPTSQ
ncbi:flagellar filament capping protein FliD [Noviherbaspirillum sp.]|uniref:flagellar filament capping protein FliD n=1 Tax=Noviherbaspirillum sp. TaxID=1926288 RepID=UPI002D6D0C44|nr:flagellar filament capping protein FliD [Noviherbaspirillum sp.]HZW20784.1 flagellar filament capping protein FliD [Noviherbaspirillum sp.]